MDNEIIKSKNGGNKMGKQKLKIGDKVRVIKECFGHDAKIGEIGTVRGFSGFTGSFGYVGVELEKQRGDRHSCRGLCKAGHGQWIRDDNLEKITDKAVTEQKIVITTDGTTTTAKFYEDGRIAKTATAKCHPEDKFNFNTGAKCAFERLLGEVRPLEEPKEAESTQPKFKVGDKVRVVRNITDKADKDDYIGKIYTIKEVYAGMYTKGVAYDIGEFRIVYEKEIELVAEVRNTPQPKFKVGDKIKVIKIPDSNTWRKPYEGNIYTIRAVNPTGVFGGVTYDIGKDYVVFESEIELAPQLYNGKVVCVEVSQENEGSLTKGKIYQFVDGYAKVTVGTSCYFGNIRPYKSFEDFITHTSSKFIEIKE